MKKKINSAIWQIFKRNFVSFVQPFCHRSLFRPSTAKTLYFEKRKTCESYLYIVNEEAKFTTSCDLQLFPGGLRHPHSLTYCYRNVPIGCFFAPYAAVRPTFDVFSTRLLRQALIQTRLTKRKKRIFPPPQPKNKCFFFNASPPPYPCFKK